MYKRQIEQRKVDDYNATPGQDSLTADGKRHLFDSVYDLSLIHISKRYYWLKLKEDFFEDDTIAWIEEQERGKDYVLFYLCPCGV